jgi:hypothetical protein
VQDVAFGSGADDHINQWNVCSGHQLCQSRHSVLAPRQAESSIPPSPKLAHNDQLSLRNGRLTCLKEILPGMSSGCQRTGTAFGTARFWHPPLNYRDCLAFRAAFAPSIIGATENLELVNKAMSWFMSGVVIRTGR